MEMGIAENLYEAVDVIINNKINNKQEDRTELCFIKSFDKEKDNVKFYLVNNGTQSYTAVAQAGSTFNEGDSVYVLIPQGDYNQTKIILGKKYSAEEVTEHTKYVNPRDSYADFNGNILKIYVNNNDIFETTLTDDKQKQAQIIATSQETEIFYGADTAHLSFKLKADLQNSGITKGDYGIMLRMTTSGLSNVNSKIQQLRTEQQKYEKNSDIYNDYEERINLIKQYGQGSQIIELFEIADIWGNPYDLEDFVPQDIQWNIEPYVKYSNIEIILFQRGNSNFKGLDTANRTIQVKDVKLFFGTKYANFKEDTLILKTANNLHYWSSLSNNTQTLQLYWIHNDNGKWYTVTKRDDPSVSLINFTINWQYTWGNEKNWYNLNINKRQFQVQKTFGKNTINAKFKASISYSIGDQIKIIESSILELWKLEDPRAHENGLLNLDLNYIQNIEPVQNAGIIKTIAFENNLKYNNNFTAPENSFINIKEILVQLTGETKEKEELNPGDTIVYYIPKERTMIRKPLKGFEFDGNDKMYDGDSSITQWEWEQNDEQQGIVTLSGRGELKKGYWVIVKPILETTDEIIIKYRNKQKYIPFFLNNNIICEIHRTSGAIHTSSINIVYNMNNNRIGKYYPEIVWHNELKNSDNLSIDIDEPAIWWNKTKRLYPSVSLWDEEGKCLNNFTWGMSIKISSYTDDTKTSFVTDTIQYSGPNTFTDEIINNIKYQDKELRIICTFTFKIEDKNWTTTVGIPVGSENIFGMDGVSEVIYTRNGTSPKPNSIHKQSIKKNENHMDSRDVGFFSKIHYIPMQKQINLLAIDEEKSPDGMIQTENSLSNEYFTYDEFVPQPSESSPFESVSYYEGEDSFWHQPILYLAEENLALSPIKKETKQYTTSTVEDNGQGYSFYAEEGSYGTLDKTGAFSGIISGKVTGIGTKNDFIWNKAFGWTDNNAKESLYGFYGFKEDVPTFGILETGDAFFEGTVVSKNGSIGGWTLDINKLYAPHTIGGNTLYTVLQSLPDNIGGEGSSAILVGMPSGPNGEFVWDTNYAQLSKFRVDYSGNIFSKGYLDVQGSIITNTNFMVAEKQNGQSVYHTGVDGVLNLADGKQCIVKKGIITLIQ